MFRADPHPLLVLQDGPFRATDAPTAVSDKSIKSKNWRKKLDDEKSALADWQERLYAHGRYAMLVVFQALDAGGKDSAIRRVFGGVNPVGLHVTGFKRPSAVELAHDFLWRTTAHLPERGHIGVFSRSHYEEVLVVRVHPELLDAQRLPERPADLWKQRYRSIVEYERHLASEGTVILKFWLNLSKDEQRKRLLERMVKPAKRWKFNPGDFQERAYWDAYLDAYDRCLRATSRPWAPWYTIPADDKPYAQWQIASLINAAFAKLPLELPPPTAAETAAMDDARSSLDGE